MGLHRILVFVSYKPSARDPEGETLARELRSLGYDSLSGVRAGKAFLFTVEASNEGEAVSVVKRIARETRLYNPSVHELLVIRVA